MGYDAAEQAYGEHRFAEAQELLNEHLTEQPDDPRALLLQAYIHFYGFQDTAAAASSYRRVLDLATEGPYHDLALEGLKHCPVSERQAKTAEPTVEPAPCLVSSAAT
jgi:cytochrome c-type biogenesis protein CcmH/NrfG